MSSITYYFRRLSQSTTDEGHIIAQVIHQQQSGSITLPYRISSSEWNEMTKTLRFILSDPLRNAYLEKVQVYLEQTYQEIKEGLEKLSVKEPPSSFRQMIRSFRIKYREKGISEWVQTLSKELTDSGCFRTARAYGTTMRSLLNFVGKKDLSPADITEKLILQYERFLKEKKLSLNTISFYMRNLRAICNKGCKQGIFLLSTEKIFSKVYTKVAVSRKKALTKREMKVLENLLHAPDTPADEKDTLRLFMFAFHARGMSFVDLAYLKKNDINLRGNKLSYFRRKTGQFIEMSLNSSLRQLIHYFMETNPSSPFLFPIIKDPTQNGYMQYCAGLRLQNQRLKQIAVRARLGKNLSTHQARHAWATIAKNENIPVWVISEGLGHTSVATTYIYLDSFGISILDQAHRKVSLAISRTC